MIHDSLSSFVSDGKAALVKGPVGLVLMEDRIEAASAVRHQLDAGFAAVVAVGAAAIDIGEMGDPRVHRVHFDMAQDDALCTVVNTVIRAAPGIWMHYCYNAEYLFFPFCEHRTIGEMCGFCTEERRDAALTYVIDLYAGDLGAHPTAVSLEDAHLDRSGYYALARKTRDDEFAERQLDFFGGLRWRFEEHIPVRSRRIDRIAVFRAKPGLVLRPDHTFNDPEYNTYACPWHHSLTTALCSFRTAKALKRNPGSGYVIDSFRWHNSAPFKWHSQQLLDLGLMEPGQWF